MAVGSVVNMLMTMVRSAPTVPPAAMVQESQICARVTAVEIGANSEKSTEIRVQKRQTILQTEPVIQTCAWVTAVAIVVNIQIRMAHASQQKCIAAMDLVFHQDVVCTAEGTDANTSTRMVQSAQRELQIAATVLEFQTCAYHMGVETDAK